MKKIQAGFVLILLFVCTISFAQDPVSPFDWKVSSKRIAPNQYELIFSTSGNAAWQLYVPGQTLGDVPTTHIEFDSSVQWTQNFRDSGLIKTVQDRKST